MDHPSELVLAAYLDGTLDPEATDRSDRHVAQCVQCRTLVRNARERTGATEVPVPPDLLVRAA
jgi:anti-sigma factor RsiW